MNRVIALLAAVAVLWHTTAGCCAHHAHADGAAAGTCTHDHASPDPVGHHDDGSPVRSGCHQEFCVFSAPDGPVSLDPIADVVGVFLVDSLLGLQSADPPAVALGVSSSTAPFGFNSPALHLALGVLLL